MFWRRHDRSQSAADVPGLSKHKEVYDEPLSKSFKRVCQFLWNVMLYFALATVRCRPDVIYCLCSRHFRSRSICVKGRWQNWFFLVIVISRLHDVCAYFRRLTGAIPVICSFYTFMILVGNLFFNKFTCYESVSSQFWCGMRVHSLEKCTVSLLQTLSTIYEKGKCTLYVHVCMYNILSYSHFFMVCVYMTGW